MHQGRQRDRFRTSYSNRRRTVRRAAMFTSAGLITACLPPATALADPINQIATWTGGAGDGKWSSAGNWSPTVVPANDASNLFNVIVGNSVNLTFDLAAPTTINGISFGTGGSLTLGAG